MLLITATGNDDNAPPRPERKRYGFGSDRMAADLEAAALTLRDRGFGEVMIIADSMGGAILGPVHVAQPRAPPCSVGQ